jgi:internalin A
MPRDVLLLAIGAIFGLGSTMASLAAPSHFPSAPAWVWHWLFWGGVALMAVTACDLVILSVWRPRLLTAVFANAGLLCFAGAWIAQSSPPFVAQAAESGPMIARLAELGWTVKPNPNEILFEVAGGSLPPMDASSKYFAQLTKPFALHFQSVKGLDGLHYLADIAGCSRIEVNAGEFTDISELRGFSHIKTLIITQIPLSGVDTVDAAPLASLTELRELNLSMTRVRTVASLGALKELRRLYLGQTLITDIRALAGLDLLEYVDIRGTRVADLSPLAHKEKLTELSIGGEQIPGLSTLVHLPALKRLSIIEQRNADLSPVGALHGLETLFIWGLPQFDLSPLRNLTNLRSLQLSGIGFTLIAPVTDVQAISGLTGLTMLTLGSLQISDLRFVENMKGLEEINLNQLPITSIAALGVLPHLKKISLVQTAVVDVSPLLNLPALTELNVVRTPARADVLTELERRGVKVTRQLFVLLGGPFGVPFKRSDHSCADCFVLQPPIEMRPPMTPAMIMASTMPQASKSKRTPPMRMASRNAGMCIRSPFQRC